MAGAKEIRGKIASIKNTQKITRAMEMVAASKMRKTQERMRQSRPYATRIREVIKHVAASHSEYHHPYLQQRPVKKIGLIVISSDRGLCGSLNVNLFREVFKQLGAWQQTGIPADMCLIGRKAEMFFRRSGGNVLGVASNLGDTPNITQLIGVVRVMLDAFDNQQIDELHVAYNEFVNTMTQKPRIVKLLPLPSAEDDAEKLDHYWDYIYEPDAKELLDQLLSRYIELQVYQAVVENIACEQAAKMIAMKSASDNAGDLIKEFQLAYNKARQAAITQELAEIVGGAAAL
ncbi:MAG: F0F1 ATP synthase subunit gamma [Legionellales bacterium]|nr:F0F1 ATP synthase subunit gamma [Legionellales bacterium]